MELRQLRYFVAVAEELHFARAAARLLIATPSLSQQIKALERSLALTLFDRSSTGVSLTPAGAELLPLARSVLESADELTDAAQRIAAERATVLRLGFLPFALTATTRRLLTGFGRSSPEVTVRLRQYEWEDPSAGLLSGATDAALVRLPFTGDERLHALVLAEEPVLAVVAESHPLAGHDEVSLARLAEEPWLEAGIVTDPVFAGYWYLRDLRDVAATTVRSGAETVEEWLAEIGFGRGVNIVPTGLAEEYRRPGLAFVPVGDAPLSRLALAWPRTDATAAATALARYAAAGRRRSASR
ncbi:LysR family transcriptional regulator [Nocardioides caldifontis]|uniref:LysR family transcriptional regulator n=1 Tax=Nocardioides caldifontis TaxID=2588938 RepID=UPI0011DF5CF7|nr:LysR substrate-binding domain-containing protein [Nocardioides caldifontis]